MGVGIGESMSGKEFGDIFDEKMTILPVDDGDHKVGHIVFILGETIAKYKDMP
jgi:hypothetical protein